MLALAMLAGSQPAASCDRPLRACYDAMGGQSWKNAAGRSWLDANIPCCEKAFKSPFLNGVALAAPVVSRCVCQSAPVRALVVPSERGACILRILLRTVRRAAANNANLTVRELQHGGVRFVGK